VFCSVCVCYISYKIYSDPTIVTTFLKSIFFNTDNTGKGDQPGTGPDITATSPTDSSNVSQGSKTIGSSITYFFNKTYHSINPYNWFTTSNKFEVNHQRFLDQQASMHNHDTKLWPFSEVNPYFSWHQRLKIYFFGESAIENNMRLEARSAIWNIWMPEDQAGPSGTLASSLVQSVQGSPNISGLGLNLRATGFVDDIGFLNTKNILNSVPGTPREIPSVLPTQSPLLESASWDIPITGEPVVQSAVENMVRSTVESSVSSSSASIDNSPQQIVANTSTTQQVLDSANERLVASPSLTLTTDEALKRMNRLAKKGVQTPEIDLSQIF